MGAYKRVDRVGSISGLSGRLGRGVCISLWALWVVFTSFHGFRNSMMITSWTLNSQWTTCRMITFWFSNFLIAIVFRLFEIGKNIFVVPFWVSKSYSLVSTGVKNSIDNWTASKWFTSRPVDSWFVLSRRCKVILFLFSMVMPVEVWINSREKYSWNFTEDVLTFNVWIEFFITFKKKSRQNLIWYQYKN